MRKWKTPWMMISASLLVILVVFSNIYLSTVDHWNISTNLDMFFDSPKPSMDDSNNTMKSNNTKKNKLTVALCVTTKGVLFQDLVEFVDYHFAIGFQTIYMYDNADNFTLQNLSYSLHGRDQQQELVLQHHPGAKQQYKIYGNCVERQAYPEKVNTTIGDNKTKVPKQQYKHDWLAFIDTDEFLVLKRHATVVDLLNDYISFDGLRLNRVKFYFNGENQTSYQALPVTKKFQLREQVADHFVKIIARTSMIKKVHVHHVDYKDSNVRRTVDTSYRRVDRRKRRPWVNNKRPEDVAVVNHYHTKSIEEFQMKCNRGSTNPIMGSVPCWPKEEIIRHFGKDSNRTSNATFDDTAWRFLSNAVPYYKRYN